MVVVWNVVWRIIQKERKNNRFGTPRVSKMILCWCYVRIVELIKTHFRFSDYSVIIRKQKNQN